VTPRPGRPRGRLLLGLLLLLGPAGCGSADRPPGASPASSAVSSSSAAASSAAAPASAQQLERLVVTSVPSGLPRMPDAQLRPPAGAKSAADVAAYAGDPARERQVLAGYGYRFGWERFWGRGNAQTSVFLDQFRGAAGARRYATDLARNDAAHYAASWHQGSGGLPAGCQLLTADRPARSTSLPGPAAFAWCAHGPFAVAVTAVSGSAQSAVREVSAVVRAQLRRLPGS
jgi:hypothetical protein